MGSKRHRIKRYIVKVRTALKSLIFSVLPALYASELCMPSIDSSSGMVTFFILYVNSIQFIHAIKLKVLVNAVPRSAAQPRTP